MFTGRLGVTWNLSEWWDVGIHYAYLSRRIDSDELLNDVVYNVAHLALTRWW